MAKTTVQFEIEEEQAQWLTSMADKHALADGSKSLRVLLDFAMVDGDEKTIFEEIRCEYCD